MLSANDSSETISICRLIRTMTSGQSRARCARRSTSAGTNLPRRMDSRAGRARLGTTCCLSNWLWSAMGRGWRCSWAGLCNCSSTLSSRGRRMKWYTSGARTISVNTMANMTRCPKRGTFAAIRVPQCFRLRQRFMMSGSPLGPELGFFTCFCQAHTRRWFSQDTPPSFSRICRLRPVSRWFSKRSTRECNHQWTRP